MTKRMIDLRVAMMVTVVIFILACGASATPAPEEPGAQEPAVEEEYYVEAEKAVEELPPGAQPTDFNTEEYDRIYENEFLDALSNPLSTFSIDVDTASYSNARRFINNSQLPPPDAVRVEEFVNYFNYDYPPPQDEHPFSIYTELSQAPWNPAHQLAHIGLQGRKIPKEQLPDSNLVFLLDVSGSMNEPNKLPLVKQGFKLLVEQLYEKDRIAIVVYAGAAGLVLPPTPGDNKAVILQAIDNLEAGGSTAGGEGIELAYQIAKDNFIEGGNNRVILATDGDFNVGPSSDAELVRLIEQRREEDIFLTILGFGTGNYKDSKMEQLADKGNGNYAYLDNIREAKKVLVSELAGTLLTIAKDVKIQIEFNPAKVKAYRLIGYENRILAKEDFADDTKDAGELGAGHAVTALYEIIPVGADEATRPTPELKYQDTDLSAEAEKTNELMTVKLRYKQPDGDESILMVQPVLDESVSLDQASDNFKFSAAVAEFGLLLRDSQFKGEATYDQVLELAKESKGQDEAGYRAEFIRLVETVELLE
jgi:Ca-activated chloride channel family protein